MWCDIAASFGLGICLGMCPRQIELTGRLRAHTDENLGDTAAYNELRTTGKRSRKSFLLYKLQEI